MQIFLETAIKSNSEPQDKNRYLVKKGEGLFAVIRNVIKQEGVESSDSLLNQIYIQVKDIENYKEIKEGQNLDIKPILDKLPNKDAKKPLVEKNPQENSKRYYTVKKSEGMYSIIRNAMKQEGLEANDNKVNQIYSQVKELDEYKEIKEGQKIDLKPILDKLPQNQKELIGQTYKVKPKDGIYTIIRNVAIQEKGQIDEALVNRVYGSLKDNKDYKYLKIGETIDLKPVFQKLSQDKKNSHTVEKGDTFSKIIRENLDIYTAETRADLSKEEVDILLQRVANTLGKDIKLKVGDKIDLTKAKHLIENSQLEELKQIEENYTKKVVDKKTGVSKKVYVSNTRLSNNIQYKIKSGDNFEKIAKRIQKENRLNVSFKDIQIAIQKANPHFNSKNMTIGKSINIPKEFPITDKVYAHAKNKTRYLRNDLSSTQRKSLMDFKKHISNPQNIAKYKKISQESDMPIELVIAIHWRESRGDFDTYLHNGQKLGKTTTIKPRGIYFAKGQFEKAAVDAFKRQSSYKIIYRINKETKDEASLNAFAERYNGLGAYSAGKTSGYVYAGTSAYTGGKYVRDGVFNASKDDNQLGTAVMIDYLFSKEGKQYLK